MAVQDALARPVADELLECLRTEVAKVANPPAKVELRTGDVVNFFMTQDKDECCDGLAWVRVQNITPGYPEQQVEVTVSNEILNWSVNLEMGVVRCAPRDPTVIPPAKEWSDVTYDVLDDAAAMIRAMCCFAAPRKGRVVPGIWTPLALDGGCTGGFMPLTVRRSPCTCDPTETIKA